MMVSTVKTYNKGGDMPKANKYEYNGKLMTVSELMEFSSVCKRALQERLKKGWIVDDALKLPSMLNRQKSSLPKKNKDRQYKSHITEESKAKAETNHKLDDLIEERRLKKELEDF